MHISGSQDQLIQLRQSQPINTALMINFHFALLLEQILALDANCSVNAWLGTGSEHITGCLSLLSCQSSHRINALNENNSYLDY